jgi:hypothetical protein
VRASIGKEYALNDVFVGCMAQRKYIQAAAAPTTGG